VITLTNRAGRVLSALHVAHLRVDLVGTRAAIASGRCQAGDYFGPAPSSPPISQAVGVSGVGGSSTACPPSGSARGLPDGDIVQTDDFSAGETRTEVPLLASFSPSDGTALYGSFTAVARVGAPGPGGSTAGSTVALTIAPAGSDHAVFSSSNVAAPGGVGVPALAAGVYDARWVVHDVNGDTRTVKTILVEEP
jgi:hypothetical protein